MHREASLACKRVSTLRWGKQSCPVFLSVMDGNAFSSSVAVKSEHFSVLTPSSIASARMGWTGKRVSTIFFIFATCMEQGDQWESSFLVTVYPRPDGSLITSLSLCQQRAFAVDFGAEFLFPSLMLCRSMGHLVLALWTLSN